VKACGVLWCWVYRLLCPMLIVTSRQTFHALENLVMYGIDVDSPEHVLVLLGVLEEVKWFLTTAGRCPLIIALVGVVVDERRRPVKLLFELADRDSLEDYIRQGWEAAAPAGVSVPPVSLLVVSCGVVPH
jgi:hypothetical protein